MRLLRLELWDWRLFREGPWRVEFAPDGTVVSGRNESGKSSLFEAVRRTLFDRNRTQSRWAQRLAPYGSPGAVPRTVLDFEHGARRLRIEKGFGPRGKARLCEVSGDGTVSDLCHDDEASERLLEILRMRGGGGRAGSRPEDWGAFHWLFMPQAPEERQLPTPESEAVGVLGLGHAGVSRDYELVLAAARRECDRWFTATGRARTGSELARAEEAREVLTAERDRLQADMISIEERRRRYDELEEAVPRLREDFEAASSRWDAVRDEAVDLSQARGALSAAEERLHACQQAARVARRTVEERERLERVAEEARSALRKREAAGAASYAEKERVDREWEAARTEAARLGAQTNEVRSQLLAAKDALDLQQKELELEDVRRRAQRAGEIDAEILEAARALRDPPGDDLVARARALEAEVRGKRHALAGARLRVRRTGAIEIEVDGVALEGEEGTALLSVVVRGPLGGEARIERTSPEERRLAEEVRELEGELSSLLAPFGAGSLQALEVLRDERLAARARVGASKREREALEKRPTDTLLARVAELEGELDTLAAKRERDPGGRLWTLQPQALRAEIAAFEEEKTRVDEAFERARSARGRMEGLHKETSARHLSVHADLEAALETDKRAAADLDRHRDEHGSTDQCRRRSDATARELAEAQEALAGSGERLASLEKEADSRRTTARLAHQRAQRSLTDAEAEMRLLEADLEREAARGAWTRLAEVERRLDDEERRSKRLEIQAGAAGRLSATLEAVRAEIVQVITAPIRQSLQRFLDQVTAGRYGLAELDEHLQPQSLRGTHRLEEFADGSEGLRELVNTLLRLSVAVSLAEREPQTLVLDDPCVHVSRERTTRLVELLNALMQRFPLQVVILTHRRAEFGGLAGTVLDLETLAAPGARAGG